MAGSFSLLLRIYLSVYNWIVFFGWFQILFLALKTLKDSGHEQIYSAVERPLLLAQSAAVLEILHGLLGLVNSSVTATVPQISARLYVTWGILWSFPEVQTHMFFTLVIFSWSITEVIRYSFYGCKEALGFAPSWLLWLRYSSFLLLYPSGLIGEAGSIYTALRYMKESGKYCTSFYSAVVFLGALVPGFVHMFTHMLRQRKRALAKSKWD